jgi:hypothetical protein
MAGAKISWSGNAVQNLSNFPDKVVNLLVVQSQISQAKMTNAARANHGPDAHGQGRFISRHGGSGLVGSIMPGPVTVTETGVEFSVIARAPYAGYVEGDPNMKKTDIGVYPFLQPAGENELPEFIARLKLGIAAIKP